MSAACFYRQARPNPNPNPNPTRHASPYFSQNYAVYVPRPAAAADGGSRIELRGCEVSSSTGHYLLPTAYYLLRTANYSLLR